MSERSSPSPSEKSDVESPAATPKVFSKHEAADHHKGKHHEEKDKDKDKKCCIEWCDKYHQFNIQSDIGKQARLQDSNLVNPWGITFVPCKDRIWVANNGTGVLTNYKLNGIPCGNPVSVPDGSPTGLVYNKDKDNWLICDPSVIVAQRRCAPSKLITATEGGSIYGFNPEIDSANMLTLLDNSGSAVYKGLTIIKDFLYVANFLSGFIEKYDKKMNLVSTFTDQDLVNAGYAPFNVAGVCGKLYVAFAKRPGRGKASESNGVEEKKDPKATVPSFDEIHGPGEGYIDVFCQDGCLDKRLVQRGPLNAPWGMVGARIGKCLTKVLIVGNFGDGTINVFDLENGTFIGPLKNKCGNPIIIDSIWGLLLHSEAECHRRRKCKCEWHVKCRCECSCRGKCSCRGSCRCHRKCKCEKVRCCKCTERREKCKCPEKFTCPSKERHEHKDHKHKDHKDKEGCGCGKKEHHEHDNEKALFFAAGINFENHGLLGKLTLEKCCCC